VIAGVLGARGPLVGARVRVAVLPSFCRPLCRHPALRVASRVCDSVRSHFDFWLRLLPLLLLLPPPPLLLPLPPPPPLLLPLPQEKKLKLSSGGLEQWQCPTPERALEVYAPFVDLLHRMLVSAAESASCPVSPLGGQSARQCVRRRFMPAAALSTASVRVSSLPPHTRVEVARVLLCGQHAINVARSSG
jgi:hypothetical protein